MAGRQARVSMSIRLGIAMMDSGRTMLSTAKVLSSTKLDRPSEVPGKMVSPTEILKSNYAVVRSIEEVSSEG